jgi:hypothetical protein
MPLVTRYGWLLGVVGEARCFDGVWFAPVCGAVEDPEDRPSHYLCDYAHVGSDSEGFDLDGGDGVWVRAAIPGVFGYSPLHVDDGRPFLLDAAFVAVLPEGEGCWAAYPFACTDESRKTGLVFSRRVSEADLRDRIARAFWGLLVAEGAGRLSPFTASGVLFLEYNWDGDAMLGTLLVVGYSGGRFFAEELIDPGEEDD